MTNHTVLNITGCSCPACAQGPSDPEQAGMERAGLATAGARSTSATLGDMADYLRTGFWGETGFQHNLGSTGIDPNNGVLHYNVTGTGGALGYSGLGDANGVTSARAGLIRDAFDLYSAVLGIEFVETTDTSKDVVDFFFTDNERGAFASTMLFDDGTAHYSHINVERKWSNGTSTYDDYTLQTILHEIGHGLGLGHQGKYNGSGSYKSDARFAIDSWQATMMSYFSQTENTAVKADNAYLQTPMAVDWIALNDIYGQYGYGTSNAFLGDTIYGFDTNITSDVSQIWNRFSDYAHRTASTIIDGGGIDMLDLSGYSATQKIDLTVQTDDQRSQNTSDIGGRIGNLTLGVGTVIEHVRGGSGNDTIIGNAADNVLIGGAGDDVLNGKAGNDTFHGGAGRDTVVYDDSFSSFAFSMIDGALEVIGDGIDFVYDTIESLTFTDKTVSFDEVVALTLHKGQLIVSTDDRTVAAPVKTYAGYQDQGDTIVTADSTGVELRNNAWKSIDLNVEITKDTILSFDFRSDVVGEIHGIGFDKDDAQSTHWMFQLAGNETSGIQNYRGDYVDGAGVRHYEIAVGEYFTGDFSKLVLVMDDDKKVGANSIFENISITQAPQGRHLDVSMGTETVAASVKTYGGYQDQGHTVLTSDSTGIELRNNAWKSIDLDVEITKDTILSFDFRSDVAGEIHGIGFDKDDAQSTHWMFQLAGNETSGIQNYRGDYVDGAGVRHYEIAVGEYFTGDFSKLVLVMDDDKMVGANSIFENISITQAPQGRHLDVSMGTETVAASVKTYGGYQDQGHTVLTSDSTGIELRNNAWKSIDLDVEVTKDTILSFDFRSDVAGEVHGIGFDNDDALSTHWMFQLAGNQTSGIQNYRGDYVDGAGVRHYEIAVGEYFTGDFSKLVLVMDDDKMVGANSIFENISITQAPQFELELM
ncbi:M10 family metallopeptidase C-terminal domain-containing protein [Fulvimarina sp. 2208YS6-2-32]|uniref:M10 family metallopeptidase C-terminal domain-containing protein n=1 Tax=Fulvimarina uroteuthidis TaxID=3098149 RepID=A0ABU5I2M4_9HYPH|nr:M10 family metallopeptidase C-terminal domain-containing protein [Fulvimarina sp. 2208YS6-2-32]MDY8109392.1 M10 family metallopeptidase C-terminal domain-containing protein [Fulvimarina sp. 2208YS6-2-32]